VYVIRMRIRGVMLAGAILGVACSGSVSPSPSPTAQAPTPTAAAAATSALTFNVGAPQARMVATLIAFLDASNAGRVDAALALLTDDVGVSDCGYGPTRLITATGITAARQWLTDRAADHDQLLLENVRNENPDPASGSHVVAASYARRSSDALRSLGYPNGIKPQTATKVVFTATDDRIRGFANGPFGGPLSLCEPRP
jgi:hypothetical protein